eukprot:951625-Alexandrium_andersonii.AAC.1
MSASLVGSEMCIRDRCRARHRALHVHARRACMSSCRGRLLVLHAHSGAVSYTHLTLPTICSV